MCRERMHILSFWGDNVCSVRPNVPLKVHILSSATNCAGATKCAVTAPITTSTLLQDDNLHIQGHGSLCNDSVWHSRSSFTVDLGAEMEIKNWSVPTFNSQTIQQAYLKRGLGDVSMGTQIVIDESLKVPYGFQSICKQTCKHLVRCTLHILMYMLIFSQSNS